MRKFIVALLLSGAVATVWCSESSAFWRRRCCVCPCPCSTVADAAPAMLTFVSPSNKSYRATITREPAYDFERRHPMALHGTSATGEDFIGHDRKAAKTSFATGPHRDFASLNDLLDDLLTHHPDQQMRQRNPPISKDETSNRVPEENRNVTVTAWLYAAKKEANDNDYHLIIGTDPEVSPIRYMNTEISALPTGANKAALRVPRLAFKEFLRDRHESVNTSGYFRWEDPVQVRVTGSLFYDIDHAPGKVGSFAKEPKRVAETAWEIHPVRTIVFEP